NETISFGVKETKAYVEGTLALQETMRTYAVRERRLRTAIAAAGKLRESGGRHAEIEVGGVLQLTPDQELCLREFSGLAIGTKYVREGGKRVAREAVTLRNGWHTKAARALREGEKNLDPIELREYWGFDDDLASEMEPRPIVGGLVGRGGGGEWAAAARLNIGYGPNEQQMLVSEIWDEQFKARLAYAADPFCKQGIRISTNFVLGRGLSVTAADKNVQTVLDEYDVRHPQAQKKKHLRSALVMGDLFLWKQPLMNGKVRHVKLPAQTIWAIVTLAEDITTPLYYVQRYYTRSQMYAQPDNGARYIERLIPADQVIHWKLNAEEDEVRGRSETYAALPWHLKYRNHWEAQIEKDYAAAAYAFVAFVEGNDAQVRKFVAQNIPRHRPRPGHTRVFNSKVKSFEVVSSDKNSPSGQGSTSEGILNALSANYGFAKEYFGVDGNRTRGGAVTSAGPAEKSFEDRQDDYGDIVRQEYQDAIDAAVAWGTIPLVDATGKPTDL
ncbi:MAG: hypothetical protein IAI49_13640, partial [Candidatus Eremiobacteraeota bacterium]|nr:hypothetical protein [Candidatus Eremiobacteraeota bacterium]